ncbi:flagellar motor protein MotB (plasmid) [Citricoccus nitrophenolicus]
MARRRKAPDDAPVHMDERWAISYLDMMTVLFLTFVVLFSMSSIDSAKYEQLKNSLQTGFGQEQTDLDDTTAGVMTESPGDKEVSGAMTSDEKLKAIQADVTQKLEAVGQESAVEFERVGGSLVIRIVSGETLFTIDEATLSDKAVTLLNSITPSILKHDGMITVEGHADYRQPLNYETNWELSSDRAVKVLRYMVEKQDAPVTDVAALGYGSTRPVEGKRDMYDRNRRVDIVVETVSDPGAEAVAQPETEAAAAGH